MRLIETDKAKVIETEEKVSNLRKGVLSGAVVTTAMLTQLTVQAASVKGYNAMVILPAVLCAVSIWVGCISVRKFLKEIGVETLV